MPPPDTLYRPVTDTKRTQLSAVAGSYRFIYSGIPSRAVARLIPDNDICRVTIDRIHFPVRRPPSLHLSVYTHAGNTYPLLAEYLGNEALEYANNEIKRLQKSRRGQLKSSDVNHSVVADHELGLVLRRPGLDSRLPGLQVLYDQQRLKNVVERLTGESCDTIQVGLIAHRLGKRAILRIELPDARVYFARLFTDKNDSALISYKRHKLLYQLVSSQRALTIPRPVSFDKPTGIALYDMLPGEPLNLSSEQAPDHCRRVALAIRALQALSDFGAPVHTGVDEAALLQRFYNPVKLLLPDLANRLSALLNSICRALSSTPIRDPVICHRDLHTDQIFINDNRIGILDFDTVCRSSAALDPGNLAAHIFFSALGGESWNTDSESLLAAEFTDLNDRDFRLWRSSALLRLALIYCFSSAHRDLIPALIEEVERCASM